MKKYIFILLLFTQPLLAQTESVLAANVSEAQAKVWDIGLQLNSAIYKLNVMKLDWQKDKLTAALTQAQQAGDTVSAGKIQDKLTDIDHRKDVEKQKLDLNNQLIAAKQQGDQGKVDSIMFQLKSLQ
jgi:acyl-CoA synthetase (NDP forming)